MYSFLTGAHQEGYTSWVPTVKQTQCRDHLIIFSPPAWLDISPNIVLAWNLPRVEQLAPNLLVSPGLYMNSAPSDLSTQYIRTDAHRFAPWPQIATWKRAKQSYFWKSSLPVEAQLFISQARLYSFLLKHGIWLRHNTLDKLIFFCCISKWCLYRKGKL